MQWSKRQKPHDPKAPYDDYDESDNTREKVGTVRLEKLESWSEHIVNVAERDYMDGYLKGGWRKSVVTRIFAWVMWTFHLSFMVHAEFRERQQ